MHNIRPTISMILCAALLTVAAQGLAAQGTARKSISAWVKCGGGGDEFVGVARAFEAARHSAFTLLVDCPVRIHIGTDIARTIFIDDRTSVEFSGEGRLIIDNVFHPAFVIANSSDIVLANWNLEYDASLPVDMKTGGYENAGKFVASDRNAPASGAFSDLRLTEWLSRNRNIKFDKSQGSVSPIWVGPTNTSAVFFVTGDSGNVKVTGMRLHAPAGAGGERFVPVAFSLSANYKSNQRVTSATPRTPQFVAVPHGLVFSDIDLDGYYMGWQGNAQNATFEKVRAHRYGDLQDANGENVGGVGKWFAPPHLFYFNYLITGDPGLFNRNLRIHDVVDGGPRVGVARDKGGSDSGSGFDMTLKIGGINCSVDQYTSTRPDGFVDVLSSDGLTISNVNASYDSSFLNDQYSGWRFPQGPYKRVTFKNIVFKDMAASSLQQPITAANLASNEGIVFSNVRVEINHWAGKGELLPVIVGTGNSVDLEYSITGESTRLRWH
ncbi:MAG TPA: hypothetical protein VN325_25620 [Steroidobacteraceae bacterium]|nr:hypothetical protein [Steroidobacteraceae bacterium]